MRDDEVLSDKFTAGECEVRDGDGNRIDVTGTHCFERDAAKEAGR